MTMYRKMFLVEGPGVDRKTEKGHAFLCAASLIDDTQYKEPFSPIRCHVLGLYNGGGENAVPLDGDVLIALGDKIVLYTDRKRPWIKMDLSIKALGMYIGEYLPIKGETGSETLVNYGYSEYLGRRIA